MDVQKHYRFLWCVFHEFGEFLKAIVTIVGDDCKPNRSVINVTDIPIIGSASYILQIAVKELLSETEPIIKQVHA